MKMLKNVMTCCLAIALVAGCGNGDGNGDPDGTTDPTEEGVDDPVEETIEDPVEEGECPPDTATEIYIDVGGQVQSLVPGGSVEGLMVAAISPLDALGTGDPTLLATTITDADGMFLIECLDVGTIALGLVLLVDDDPDGTADDYFPTGTGVAAYADASDKVDLYDAAPFAVANTLVAGIEALTGLDTSTDGLVMGLIVDGATHAPIDGAVLNQHPAGTPADVSYPTADFSALETDDNTSANGSFVFNSSITLSSYIAVADGYTFSEHQAASKPDFCYFSIHASE